jgi:pilus assembly protein CpaC
MFRRWFPLLFIGLLFFPAVSSAVADPINLAIGEAKVLTIKDFTKIANSNPDVIELVVTNGQEILLNAKKVGLSEVNVWTNTDQFSYKIIVQESYSSVEAEIARLINNSGISVKVNEKFVILSGTVASSLEADQAVQYGKIYRENVINNLTIKTNYQILLSILVTELKKDSEKKYGFNTGTWWPSQSGSPVFNDWEYGLIYNQSGVSLVPGTSIGSMLNLMQSKGDAKILAAPSIVTVSGKEADFLAGGEIPIPMSDGKGGVIVDWKEYGIKLKVTPILERNNTITMLVSPEVSSIDWTNAITVSGFKLPALETRKVTTNVNFSDGATLVIGGLLKREDSVNVYKLPILSDIPVIGALFRSKSFQKGDTELLFFVTPKIVKDDTKLDPTTLTNPVNQGPYFESDPKK